MSYYEDNMYDESTFGDIERVNKTNIPVWLQPYDNNNIFYNKMKYKNMTKETRFAYLIEKIDHTYFEDDIITKVIE